MSDLLLKEDGDKILQETTDKIALIDLIEGFGTVVLTLSVTGVGQSPSFGPLPRRSYFKSQAVHRASTY